MNIFKNLFMRRVLNGYLNPAFFPNGIRVCERCKGEEQAEDLKDCWHCHGTLCFGCCPTPGTLDPQRCEKCPSDHIILTSHTETTRSWLCMRCKHTFTTIAPTD